MARDRLRMNLPLGWIIPASSDFVFLRASSLAVSGP
jgi:hypothetical protein